MRFDLLDTRGVRVSRHDSRDSHELTDREGLKANAFKVF
jgi:hypothetical protein